MDGVGWVDEEENSLNVRLPRLLCLHGYRSNAEIARMQVENLGLNTQFDITYLEGPIRSAEPAEDQRAAGMLSNGPYFSWMECRSGFEIDDEISALSTNMEQLLQSLKYILMHLELMQQKVRPLDSGGKLTPYYDAVYGFSQGGTLATILSHEQIVKALRYEFAEEFRHRRALHQIDGDQDVYSLSDDFERASVHDSISGSPRNSFGTINGLRRTQSFRLDRSKTNTFLRVEDDSAQPSLEKSKDGDKKSFMKSFRSFRDFVGGNRANAGPPSALLFRKIYGRPSLPNLTRTKETDIDEEVWNARACWSFAFIACAGNSAVIKELERRFFSIKNGDNREEECFVLYPKSSIGSVHYIGINDPLKGKGEFVMNEYFQREKVLPVYLNGRHEIPSYRSRTRKNVILLENMAWYTKHKYGTEDAYISLDAKQSKWHNNDLIDDNSSSVEGNLDVVKADEAYDAAIKCGETPMLCVISEMKKFDKKYPLTISSARIEVGNHSNLCSETDSFDEGANEMGKYGTYVLKKIMPSRQTLYNVLAGKNSSSPAIYAANIEQCLSYGDICHFIDNEGDLRRAGVEKNSTVAFVAPPGIAAAIAFLTIASQCTAAPLDPQYSVEDFYQAFEQLDPDVVIVFEECACLKCVISAADKIGLRVVQVASNGKGLFSLKEQIYDELDKIKEKGKLVLAPNDTALILRTSGTTSIPKMCAISMDALLSNSEVVANSLGLESFDVALNAMPLFHIGGICTNLLASLSVGASVVCMDKFDANAFISIVINGGAKLSKPTWFSAVPTMHATICDAAFAHRDIARHSLRFIRSGAASLSSDLQARLEIAFKCPVISTYSMTEQMPITQPPRSFLDAKNRFTNRGVSFGIDSDSTIPLPTSSKRNISESEQSSLKLTNLRRIKSTGCNSGYDIAPKKGSVGKAIATSLCIVDQTLRPIPANSEVDGEVCISGPTVITEYMNNALATTESFFYLGGKKWFRTGDVGRLDSDAFLYLTGRKKELIKRGGEQISPVEVEEAVLDHPMIKICIVFGIPCNIWGERVGAAIVLKEEIDDEKIYSFERAFKAELRQFLRDEKKLQMYKVPEKVIVVEEEDLPKTRSNKYTRVGLAEKLGVTSYNDLTKLKPVRIHEAVIGARFVLACWVFFNHVGDFGRWNYVRAFCLHPPAFFFLGGFLLAASTHAPVVGWDDLKCFYSIRIAVLHPMYLLSVLCATINFVIRCNPGKYEEDFQVDRVPNEGVDYVCQPSYIEMPWTVTLTSSLTSYFFGLQCWPFTIPFQWFLSMYAWFSGVYIFCVLMFPFVHKQFYINRRNRKVFGRIMILWFVLHYTFVIVFMFNRTIYNADKTVGELFAVSAYLFPPGWLPSFALGVGTYFWFSQDLPNEKLNAWQWGVATDLISVSTLAIILAHGLLGSDSSPVDTDREHRIWAYSLSRLVCPISFLWIYGLAVGKGLTAKIMSNRFLVAYLAPASYNIYLFHQPVYEWYWLATRGNWWAYPKSFYWFSPRPTPITEFWEFLVVLLITVALSILLEFKVNSFLVDWFALFVQKLNGNDDSLFIGGGADVREIVTLTIETITGAAPGSISLTMSLMETGCSSITSLVLIAKIKHQYKSLVLSPRDIFQVDTVEDLINLIKERLERTAKYGGGFDMLSHDQSSN